MIEILFVAFCFFVLYCMANVLFANFYEEVTPADKRLPMKEEDQKEKYDERETNP